MKKQIIVVMAFVLICLLAATSVVIGNNRTCNAEERHMKQLPSNDMLLHGPFNYFQL